MTNPPKETALSKEPTPLSNEEKDVEELVDYFAFGAMMNPVSVQNRNIHPVSSEPAELLDHRLGFFTSLGYADSIVEPGASLHGVIHVLRASEMAMLDAIEVGYKRKTVPARSYRGEERLVQVYYYADDSEEITLFVEDYNVPGIPSERYLDVLIQGAEHHGVKQSYIDWLKAHEKKPRPELESMHSFCHTNDDDDDGNHDPKEELLPVVSFEDVKRNDGFDGRPFWMAVNGKVLEARMSSTFSKNLTYIRKMVQPFGGILELSFGKINYDPLYGVIECWEDVTPEYSAWCEHTTWEHIHAAGDLEDVQWIARVKKS
jgi:hypothetical protein